MDNMVKAYRDIAEHAEDLRVKVCNFLEENKLTKPALKSKIDEMIVGIEELDPQTNKEEEEATNG